MKPKLESLASLLGLALLHPATFAQKPAPQQNMTVVVINAHLQPVQPVQSLRVSLSYLDGASRITDAREVTNSHGQAFLQVSPDTAQRGDIRVEIAGANDLVIYQPADGQLSTLPPTVTIQLLPKGSPALLGPSQIEAMLHRSLLQLNSLQQQNRVLKQQVAQEANQKQGLNDALIEWAKENGFAPTDVDQHVQQWAKDIQAKADHATQEQQALAQLALKNYVGAGRIFEKSEVSDEDSLDSGAEAFLKDQRDKLRQLLSDAQQAAAAFQFSLHFHAATVALQRAQNRAASEHKKFPEDGGINAIFLQTSLAFANALMQEGNFTTADQALPLLAQAVSRFQDLASQDQAAGDRQAWARAQYNLGLALVRQGTRTSGDQTLQLLDRAVQAHRSALEVYTKANQPKMWAVAQNDLGNALAAEARYAPRDKSMALLDEAVQAHQKAAEVYTKADAPFEWAHTQTYLGDAYESQAHLTTGDKALALLDQAVQAEQRALEVDTKADRPRDWASTQSSLGFAYFTQSQLSNGDKAQALIDKSLQSYQSALEVFSRTDLPQQWALMQASLGLIYMNQGRRTPGNKGSALLDQAEQAFQNALQIDTQADLPQQWAADHSNLGLTLFDQAVHTKDDKTLLRLAQAVQEMQQSLNVYTRAALPQDWARTQLNLGLALGYEGELASPDKSQALLDQSAQAFQHAEEVFTRTAVPDQWAQLQFHLGAIHADQGKYDAALADYHSSFEIQPSPLARLNLSQANLHAAHFDACLKEIALLPDPPNVQPWIVIRDSLKLACQWGIADKPSALKTEQTLLTNAPAVKPVGSFTNTVRYLSASPTFAPGRASWLALFTALQAGDASALSAALHQLEPLMQN